MMYRGKNKFGIYLEGALYTGVCNFTDSVINERSHTEYSNVNLQRRYIVRKAAADSKDFKAAIIGVQSDLA